VVETVVFVIASVPMESAMATPARKSFRGRQALAAARFEIASAALARCELCSHRCGVNRLLRPAGVCNAGHVPRIFSAQVEVGDELELIPSFAIALSGCNMRCSFCITGDESWHASRGQMVDTTALARSATRALESGAARSLLVLGGEPTVYVPWLLELVSRLPEDARLILKTNGLSTPEARALLAGLFDVWLVDFKFGDDRCAWELARMAEYCAPVRETLKWAEADAELIVRHLVMPGHVDCCWGPVAAWLSRHIPTAKVSLRFGYWPAWKALRMPGMNRPICNKEEELALAVAHDLGLRLIP
jgi:putative pyruvate formate lyase activating enzyme